MEKYIYLPAPASSRQFYSNHYQTSKRLSQLPYCHDGKKSPKIIEDVLRGKIDFGLAMIDEIDWDAHEELVFETLLEGEIMVCVNKHSPLAFSDYLTPEELINETVVMYDGENGKIPFLYL